MNPLRLLTALILAACCASLPVKADDKDDRAKMLESFDQLAEDYKSVLDKNKKGIPGFAGNLLVHIRHRDTPVGKVSSMVKVAARKYDPKTEQAGEYVSLTEYRWEAKECFLLCFQSVHPVKFQLFYMNPVANAPATPEFVLPSKDRPEREEPIPAGDRYELTNPLQMESHGDDEIIKFVFFDATNGAPKKPAGKPVVVLAGLEQNGALYRGLRETVPRKVSSDKFDDVAAVVGAKTNSGVLQLTMRKKKP